MNSVALITTLILKLELFYGVNGSPGRHELHLNVRTVTECLRRKPLHCRSELWNYVALLPTTIQRASIALTSGWCDDRYSREKLSSLLVARHLR